MTQDKLTKDAKDKQDQTDHVDGHDKNDKDKSDQSDQSTIPKHRFDSVNEKRKAAEAELKEIAEELKKDIPEDFQDLVPDLPPAQLIKWIRSAIARGLFDPKTADSPDAKRTNQKQTVDLSGLSPQQMMAKGYGKK